MQQQSKEWFDARIGKITGSNVGAALGLNPYKTPEDLVRQMVREYHREESEFSGNVATEHGSLHEPLAIMDYQSKTGNFVEECGFFVHPEHDWLGASPDGLVGELGLIEVKCPFSQRNKKPPEFKTAEEQPHYYAQMQIEMACTGRRFVDFYQWAPHGDKLESVKLDQDWLDKHMPELREFYGWYLSEIDNPAHLEPLLKEVNTLVARDLIDEYDRLKADMDDADARRKEILESLVSMAKERDAVICGRKLTKVDRKGNVQYAKIPELKGLDLEPYRGKSSQYWKLS